MSSTSASARVPADTLGAGVRQSTIHLIQLAMPLVVLGATLAYFLLFFDRGVHSNDEGTLFMAADGILNGKMLYRDLYVAYMPGGYYLYAAFFKLFGTTARVGRMLGVLLRCGNAVMIYALARRLAPIWLAVLPVIALALLPGPWHKTLFVTCSLLSLCLLARFFEQPSLPRTLALGVGTAATVLYREWLGVVVLGGTLAALAFPVFTTWFSIRAKWRATLRRAVSTVVVYLGAALLPVGLVMLCFARHGILRDLLTTVFFDALRGNLAKQGAIPAWRNPLALARFTRPQVWSLVKYNALTLLYYLPPVLSLCVLIWVVLRAARNRSRPGDALLFALGVFGLLVYALVLIEPAIAHLLVSLPVIWVLLVTIIARAGRWCSVRFRMPMWGSCAVILLPILVWFYALTAQTMQRADSYMTGSFKQRSDNPAWLALPRSGVYTTVDEAEGLGQTVSYLDARVSNGDCILVVPADGGTQRLVHFLTGTFPPYALRATAPGLDQQQLARLQQQIIAGAEERRVEYVVLTGKPEHVDAFEQRQLVHYVDSTYERVGNFGRYTVLKRKP